MGNKEEAIALKNKGNDAFKAHDWPTALEYYTKAIETYDQEPSFYTNRAQVRVLVAAHDHLLTWFDRQI
jgi:serine/threonine-protein phosphatase 5